jgi:hypothetical protein
MAMVAGSLKLNPKEMSVYLPLDFEASDRHCPTVIVSLPTSPARNRRRFFWGRFARYGFHDSGSFLFDG